MKHVGAGDEYRRKAEIAAPTETSMNPPPRICKSTMADAIEPATLPDVIQPSVKSSIPAPRAYGRIGGVGAFDEILNVEVSEDFMGISGYFMVNSDVADHNHLKVGTRLSNGSHCTLQTEVGSIHEVEIHLHKE